LFFGLVLWGQFFLWRSQAKGSRKKPVFAVLIGVQKYKYRGMTTLRYTKNDVEGLRDALVRYGGVAVGSGSMMCTEKMPT
jgi:hypothetical protein